jgi:3-phenylpropionate/trans-cinnamate dioxygenase ferredoxin reductase subunit
MTDADRIVVLGGGLAAASCCDELRQRGFDGPLVLVGAERHLPYERPPLSKGYLLGTQELETVFVHPQDWYDERGVALRLGEAATGLDLATRTVTLPSGDVAYDRLLLATGAVPRRLPLLDDSGVPTLYLRDVADSQEIKAALEPGRRVLVVGAGWIGLEVAAAARTAGCDVVVVETVHQPLLRVLGPELGAVFAALHREHGVDLRTDVAVTTARQEGGASVVGLSDGTAVTADAVVAGVGVLPSAGLASSAGLETDNGIVVDARLRTSDPHVFAAGDVANAFHPLLGRQVRVEHWDNAIAQGRAAARNMLGGDEDYTRLPYFFSDQYDLGMEYVGHVGPDGYDEVVVRGDLSKRVFTAFWVHDGRVVAGMHANDWDAIEPLRAVVGAGRVDLDHLRDPRVPLSDVAPETA